MKKSVAAYVRSPEVLATTISASSAIRAGAVSDGLTATHRLAPMMQCSRFIERGVPA